jgi:hypothetical protein
MSRRTSTFLALALAAPTFALAQDTYRHGRVRHTESGVSVQRATEPGSEEAMPNLPFLPGDRVWTDAQGRVEFQFADGTLLRLDSGSKLDYVAHEEGDDQRVILRLWSGSLIVHPRGARVSPAFAVETPGGVMVAEERGVYRVDVDSGETRVSVYEGQALLEADRQVRLRAGERAYARAGEAYDEAERFDLADVDDFGRWDADRQSDVRMARNVPEYLPEDISPYADELEEHGSWYYEAEVGHVWRPYVDAGWRPYHNGRWIWSSYGWTWLPYERWGWAPSHYGRWGYAPALGWYWVPGRSWAAAWVDWAIGSDYVGWCPTGWRDRHLPGRSRDRGRAVPRGSGNSAWVYAQRGDLGRRDLPQRVAMDTAVPRNMTIIEPSRTRLTRDLRVTDAPPVVARAVPRNVRTRPGPGDTTPELRSDPATTIPFPTARRRYESERDREAQRENARTRRPAPSRQAGTAGADEPAAAAPAPSAVAPAPAPGVSRPFPWTARPRPSRQKEQRERGSGADARSSEGDRDVLRPVFRPLSRPRPEGERSRGGGSDAGAREARPRREREGGGWGAAAPRGERPQPRPERPAPRAEPRAERPRGGGGGGVSAAPAPRPPDRGERAVPRNRRERQ